MAAEIFIGIDVARDSLEVAVRPTGEQWSVGNQSVGTAFRLDRFGGGVPLPDSLLFPPGTTSQLLLDRT